MEKYIKIDGGIGRVIASTGVLEEYAKNSKDKINIVSSFPQLFSGLEGISRYYNIGMPYLYEDYISKGDFIEPEPYNHYKYYNEEKHLAEVFNFILTGKEEMIAPKIILTENELEEAKSFVEEIKKKEGKKILLVQPWGSQGGIPLGEEKGIRVDESYRSFGVGFFKKFVEEFENDYVILSVQSTAHFNGQQVPQAGIKGTKAFNNPDIRKIIAVIPFVDGVVACDSFLHHASASLGTPTPTVVLWGATSEKNLGYKDQLNIVSHKKPLVEPNRVPHDHAFYVDKNKGCNEFSLEIIPQIKKYIEKKEVLVDGNNTEKVE